VRWLGIIGVILLIVGLIVPIFGPMAGRNFGLESFVLIGVGLVVLAAGTVRKRPSKDEGALDGSYGDATGSTIDHGGHNEHGGHDGGHGDGGGH
jgi:hypothetical protein